MQVGAVLMGMDMSQVHQLLQTVIFEIQVVTS